MSFLDKIQLIYTNKYRILCFQLVYYIEIYKILEKYGERLLELKTGI